MAERAIKERSCIVFFFHQVEATGHLVGMGQDLHPIADFTQMWAQVGGLKVVTVAGALEELARETEKNDLTQAG